ncbi:uncharacterized protein LOC143037084 [Oratosquilla oratoria]|uniref:uncharacterized protein LOC143037084 n=1 Tax=Oratosquilla oratoria TaxID=337810 RepID=UPI003F769469
MSGSLGPVATQMKRIKFAFLLALAALCVATADASYRYEAPQASEESHEEEEEKDYGPAKYDFAWAVEDEESGNDFGHQEERDGDRTEGSYYVQLPDGRLQKVTYYVDGDSGYVAEVTYEGEAHYPEPESTEEEEEEEEEEERRGYSYAPPRSFYGAPH